MTKPSVALGRLGVDIGGTFTDVALDHPRGWFTTKVLTTHGAPEQAVVRAIRIVLEEAGIAPIELALVIHGTTLATNAIIERKGARTAFLTTDGFRDTLEIATEGRFEIYDVNIDLPRPLVPRHWRLEVSERVSAKGVPLIPLDEDQVERLVRDVLIPDDIQSVAVGFLHAYSNAGHERRVRDILLRRVPNLSVSLSSEVSPEMREYERFSTTCANAYVQPLMSTYLRRLESELATIGIKCPVFMMQSGGGLATIETAVRFPVRLVESGPAGGAVFSEYLARQMDISRILSFDMGGTTAKICVIDDFVAQTARAFEVARIYRFKKGSGLPLRIPVIEMVEIGAGGGSIATIDALGRVAVGPESAGSEPGPACYGRGGLAPTVTDADVVLGRIDPALFSGGRVCLERGAAEKAVAGQLGRPMGVGAEPAAFAISEVVDTNMANAARVHAIESGKTFKNRTMIAFGGAAPLHAARVAEKLGVDRVVVPRAAGVGSCVGFLRAPAAFEIVQSFYQNIDEFDTESANRAFELMRREAQEAVERAAPDTTLEERRVAYMRYVGQGSEIVVRLPNARFRENGAEILRKAFEDAYAAQYQRTVPGSRIEVISFGITISAPRPTMQERAEQVTPHEAAPEGVARIFDAETESMIEVKKYRRDSLRPGAWITGPAVIAEAQTTTVVPVGFDAAIECHGHIELSRRVTSPEN